MSKSKENSDNKENIALLKEISQKLSNLDNKKEDKLFQLALLDIQVRQNNTVLLISVSSSIGIAFLVTYLTIALSGVIEANQFNFLASVLGLMSLLFIIVYCIMWLIIHSWMIKKVNELRDKVNKDKNP